MNLLEERTLALSGVAQACKQVQSLARTGGGNQDDIDACVQSILVLDAVSTPAVYGGLDKLHTGLTMVRDGIIRSTESADIEVLRYAVAILHLQSQMYQDQERFAAFSNAVERLSASSSDDLIDACSQVYQDHVSVLKPQIIVQGESEFLQDPTIPPQIRALLLAAFRSAVLWQQKGGGRFKLLWQRTRMQNAARDLLQQVAVH